MILFILVLFPAQDGYGRAARQTFRVAGAHRLAPGSRHADYQPFCFDHEEEPQATKKKPRPNPDRDGLGFKERLKWPCMGKQKLQKL